MAIPQSLSYVSLGARDFPALRQFYRSLGWSETSDSSDEWCSFDMGGSLLALYPLDLLTEEAAPGEAQPTAPWRGFTLAINVQTEAELRAVYDAAVRAGADTISELTRREWGGMSGYLADPEGNRWELAVGSDALESKALESDAVESDAVERKAFQDPPS